MSESINQRKMLVRLQAENAELRVVNSCLKNAMALCNVAEARVKELEAELSNVWSRCKVVYFPHDGSYPIEHDARANKIMRTEIEKHLGINSKREGDDEEVENRNKED